MRAIAIVEGHGEVEAVRTLLQRIWTELLGRGHLEVLRPIRWPKSKLVQEKELVRAIELARLKLEAAGDLTQGLVLVLLDADRDLPCELAPKLLRFGQGKGAPNLALVLANVEYETWFIAAADSLSQYLDLEAAHPLPVTPEEDRLGKTWIRKHFKGPKYSETVDQPRLTARMDLELCRERSPSFAKLCRELAGFAALQKS